MRRLPPELLGAILLSLLGAPGALIMRAAPPAGVSGAAAAATLIVGVAMSGAVGGFAFRHLAAWRDRVPSAQWLGGVYSAGATLLIFTLMLLGRAGLSVGGTILGDFRAVFMFAIALFITASIVVDVARREARMPGQDAYTLPPSGFRYGTLILGAFLLTMARERPAGEEPPLVEMPRSVEQARAILADTESGALAPESRQAQLRYGLALSYVDRHEEAVSWLEKAMQLDSSDVLTQSSLGWVYMRAGRYDDALPHLRRAASEWPDDVDVHHNIGWTLLKLQRFDESAHHYRVAVRLDSTRAELHSQLAWALYGQSNEEDALVHVQRALELDPTDETHGLAGTILQAQAKFAEARDHFRQALRLSPERADFWAHAGIASYLMNDIVAARREFAEAWRRDSTYFTPYSVATNMRKEALRAGAGDASQAGQPAKDGRP